VLASVIEAGFFIQKALAFAVEAQAFAVEAQAFTLEALAFTLEAQASAVEAGAFTAGGWFPVLYLPLDVIKDNTGTGKDADAPLVFNGSGKKAEKTVEVLVLSFFSCHKDRPFLVGVGFLEIAVIGFVEFYLGKGFFAGVGYIDPVHAFGGREPAAARCFFCKVQKSGYSARFNLIGRPQGQGEGPTRLYFLVENHIEDIRMGFEACAVVYRQIPSGLFFCHDCAPYSTFKTSGPVMLAGRPIAVWLVVVTG
jgi:hypothetical protein